MKVQLPGGAWEELFPRALVLIDEICRHGGLSDPFWTFGGGTVLMFRYRHRLAPSRWRRLPRSLRRRCTTVTTALRRGGVVTLTVNGRNIGRMLRFRRRQTDFG